MPKFEKSTGFKMKGASIIGGTQKHADALEAQRSASVKKQKADCPCPEKPNCACGEDSPNKFWMKAAGMVIGANKRRQASKDAADASVAAGKQAAYSKKLS